MDNKITIREAVTEKDIAAFWEQLYAYYKRDMFPDPKDEDLQYFLGQEYRDHMSKIHSRPQNRCHYLFFHWAGQDIGLALPVIFTSEDGKCFIMEFCVYPQFRGNGTGKACAKVLLDWAKACGAVYAELNYGGSLRREKFWQSVGFVKNGSDEWGEPLMILPPEDEMPFTVEILADPEDWQLLKLENGFKQEIGEEALPEEKQKQLQQAVKDGRITFFIARRGCRAVGMCSVIKCFSTFTCSDTGIFEDFFVEPAFRGKGIARMLADAAQLWCRKNNITSLTVCCASCDEGMYRHLGFHVPLGTTLACTSWSEIND